MDNIALERSPLGSRAATRVLQLLALNPSRPFFLRELARLTGERVNGVSQALRRLLADGLVRTEALGGRRAYLIDAANPYFPELQRIALKSLDLPGVLDAAGVTALRIYVYGSFAKGTADAASDIDLLVVGAETTPGAAEEALAAVGHRLNRAISVRVVPDAEYQRQLADPATFISAVAGGPLIELQVRP